MPSFFSVEQARKFANDWVAAWNRHDIEAVLEHFSDDVEFSSPLVSLFTGNPTNRLVGKASVRTYWQLGLAHLPDLHFTLVDVLVGVDCLTMVYRGHRGLAAEVLQFDDDTQVICGQAFYSA
jgi:ketosteroid isomerase-like protein